MKFEFRLERLLDLRMRAEDDCKVRLAQALLTLREAADAVDRTLAAQQELNRSWQVAVAEGLCSADAEDYQQCAVTLEKTQDARRKTFEQAETAVACRRLDLEAAVAKRRSLEKFKDRAKRRFQLVEQMAEQKQLDDLAIMRAGGRE
jgi:flagellar export protein FliJ